MHGRRARQQRCKGNGIQEATTTIERAEVEAIQKTGTQRRGGGTATIERAEAEVKQKMGTQMGSGAAAIEKIKANAIHKKRTQKERYGDNTETGSSGYTENGDPQGGGTVAIEKAEAQAIQKTWTRYSDNRKTRSKGYT